MNPQALSTGITFDPCSSIGCGPEGHAYQSFFGIHPCSEQRLKEERSGPRIR
jgi:hypothetical protein